MVVNVRTSQIGRRFWKQRKQFCRTSCTSKAHGYQLRHPVGSRPDNRLAGCSMTCRPHRMGERCLTQILLQVRLPCATLLFRVVWEPKNKKKFDGASTASPVFPAACILATEVIPDAPSAR